MSVREQFGVNTTTDDDESMLESFGALTKCLSRAVAQMTLLQLDEYEAEVLEMLHSGEDRPHQEPP